MSGLSVLSMRWTDVLFAHWAVNPAVVADRLPDSLEVDTYEGTAYLGVVGFRMESLRPRGSPLGRTFPELNLRTYVDGPNGPGTYFFNLDAGDGLSVYLARRLFHLSYYRADMRVAWEEGGIRFRSSRTHEGAPPCEFDATYTPEGEASPTDPSSLAAFLTERYRFYADGDSRLYVGPVEHPPWDLQDADLVLKENDLFAANGFEKPEGEPLVHYSPGVDVTAELIRPVDSSLPVALPV